MRDIFDINVAVDILQNLDVGLLLKVCDQDKLQTRCGAIRVNSIFPGGNTSNIILSRAL